MLRRLVLLGFLVFGVGFVTLPTTVYAMSLDDEEEDAEDVADLLEEAKSAGNSESFGKADALLKKAKMYGVEGSDVSEAQSYVSKKKQLRDERLERERKERERLAKLKREKEERERQARLERQRQQSANYGSSGYSKGAISLCVPSIPYKANQTTECSAKTASGSYATVKLTKEYIGDCYTFDVYGGRGSAHGNTCGGLSSYWAIAANGRTGSANGVSSAIAWGLSQL